MSIESKCDVEPRVGEQHRRSSID